MTEFDMSQYKELFIEEAQENLQALNQVLLQLEKEPSNVEPLNEIFRLAHTTKGMAATMGYDNIAHLAHSMEDLLDELRQGTLEVEPRLFDLLFDCLDALGTMLEDVVADRESDVLGVWKSHLDLESMVGRLEASLTKSPFVLHTAPDWLQVPRSGDAPMGAPPKRWTA